MKITLLLVHLLISPILIAQNLDSWLQQNIVPISTCKPNNDFEDLKQLTKYLNNAQIIGLGETSHGQGSFFEMKHRFFRFSVQELGYHIFALEAGFAECLKINDYVLNGNGEAISALKYLNYGVWEIQELKDLIEYMRQYNLSHNNKVKFYGFDCQMATGAIDYIFGIKDKINYTPTQSDEQLLANLKLLQKTRASDDAKLLQPLLTILIEKLNKLIEQSSLIDHTEKIKARIICRTLAQFCENEINNNNETRAKFMAENVKHIVDLEGENSKIILSAHNGHIYKDPAAKEFGYYLNQLFANKYYAIGFEFNKGKIQGFDFIDDKLMWKEYDLQAAAPKSLGDVLLKGNKDFLFLDLYQAQNNNTLPKWFYKKQKCGDILGCYGQKGCNKRYWHIVLSKSYDAILFIKATERAKKI